MRYCVMRNPILVKYARRHALFVDGRGNGNHVFGPAGILLLKALDISEHCFFFRDITFSAWFVQLPVEHIVELGLVYLLLFIIALDVP